MVLESLINPIKAERHPFRLFMVGFLYSSIGMVLSLWVFREYASLVMIFLTVLASTPLLYHTMKVEEEKDIEYKSEKKLLKEHGKAISFLVFLFLGMVVSFTLWYAMLPTSVTTDLFSIQTGMISSINSKITGNAISTAGLFGKIFMNNLKVMIFCILFSFIYGAGAIFILSWNASVIGVAVGNFIKSYIASAAASTGSTGVATYFAAASLGVMRYSLHGIPEILAYLIAGLAGGIISVAAIRHNYTTKSFERIIMDSSDMVILSVALLFFAALIEVFITPTFF